MLQQTKLLRGEKSYIYWPLDSSCNNLERVTFRKVNLHIVAGLPLLYRDVKSNTVPTGCVCEAPETYCLFKNLLLFLYEEMHSNEF